MKNRNHDSYMSSNISYHLISCMKVHVSEDRMTHNIVYDAYQSPDVYVTCSDGNCHNMFKLSSSYK